MQGSTPNTLAGRHFDKFIVLFHNNFIPFCFTACSQTSAKIRFGVKYVDLFANNFILGNISELDVECWSVT